MQTWGEGRRANEAAGLYRELTRGSRVVSPNQESLMSRTLEMEARERRDVKTERTTRTRYYLRSRAGGTKRGRNYEGR